MAYEFKVTRQVEFYETDMAGIMHYSNFFRFMESAEHAFYRSLGFSVVLPGHNPPLGFPRVRVTCDFKRPLRFEDTVEVHLLVQERKSKSITYSFRFRNLSAEPVQEVARGSVTIVCVAMHPNGKMTATTIPGDISRLLEPAPPELLA
jgi:acyl-CoA thioester hydrolase